MDAIWISLIVVAAIIVAIAVAIAIRRHRSNDYTPTLGPDDQPDHSQYARTTAASRFSDRTGSGAGGGV
jgi:hypothetical protein